MPGRGAAPAFCGRRGCCWAGRPGEGSSREGGLNAGRKVGRQVPAKSCSCSPLHIRCCSRSVRLLPARHWRTGGRRRLVQRPPSWQHGERRVLVQGGGGGGAEAAALFGGLATRGGRGAKVEIQVADPSCAHTFQLRTGGGGHVPLKAWVCSHMKLPPCLAFTPANPQLHAAALPCHERTLPAPTSPVPCLFPDHFRSSS